MCLRMYPYVVIAAMPVEKAMVVPQMALQVAALHAVDGIMGTVNLFPNRSTTTSSETRMSSSRSSAKTR